MKNDPYFLSVGDSVLDQLKTPSTMEILWGAERKTEEMYLYIVFEKPQDTYTAITGKRIHTLCVNERVSEGTATTTTTTTTTEENKDSQFAAALCCTLSSCSSSCDRNTLSRFKDTLAWRQTQMGENQQGQEVESWQGLTAQTDLVPQVQIARSAHSETWKL